MASGRFSAAKTLEDAEELAVEVITTIVPYLRDNTPYLNVYDLEQLAMRVCHGVETDSKAKALKNKKYYLNWKRGRGRWSRKAGNF